MTTREKIIVGIMCLTVAYGAYDLLSNRRPKATRSSPVADVDSVTALKTFVADLSGKLLTEKVSSDYQHLISQAGSEWNKDPFIKSIAPLAKRRASVNLAQKTSVKTARPRYVYSGYIEIGKTKLAIINGMEYGVGDALPDKSYYIKTITPLSVVIGKINALETIHVPISETDI